MFFFFDCLFYVFWPEKKMWWEKKYLIILQINYILKYINIEISYFKL